MLEKYLNMKGFPEKSVKIKYSLKRAGKWLLGIDCREVSQTLNLHGLACLYELCICLSVYLSIHTHRCIGGKINVHFSIQ